MIILGILWSKFRYKKLSKYATVMEQNINKDKVLIKRSGKYGLLDKKRKRIILLVVYDDIKIDPVTLDVTVVYEGEHREIDII